jgi:CheY-like chemotaxis protein
MEEWASSSHPIEIEPTGQQELLGDIVFAWPSQQSRSSSATSPSETAEGLAGEQPTVLLVEDEPVILLTLGEMLRSKGVQVIETFDAEAAIGVIQSGTQVDVVLTDVRFPSGRDGFALVRWLREHQARARVFVTSGQVKRNEAIHQLEAPEAFIAKPYDAMTLASQLAALAKRSSKEN